MLSIHKEFMVLGLLRVTLNSKIKPNFLSGTREIIVIQKGIIHSEAFIV